MLNPVVKRRLMLVAKLAVIGVTAWFVRGSILDGWTKLREMIERGEWSPAGLKWGWIAAAAVLYSLGQLPCALFWRRILIGLGQHPPLGAVVRAFYIGHLGKYVPGKAMVVVMRSGMLAELGVKPGAAAVSVFYETLTMMAVGAALSAFVIAIRFREHTDWLLATLAMVAVTSLPTVPPVFEFILKHLRRGGVESAASSQVRGLGFGVLLGGWAIVAVGWFLMGLSVWAILRGAGFVPNVFVQTSLADEWTICTAAAAMSVVVGFLSFVPGGFLVREAVLMTLLEPTYGEAAALVAAVLVRLVWVVAEVGVSAMLYGWRARNKGD